MAEINSNKGGEDKKRSKKISTKIDMTPMVDLAFLLITFFMLTTTFNKPQTMKVIVPDKTKDAPKIPVKESKALTILISKEDRIFWYRGLNDIKLTETDYSPEGIRSLLASSNSKIKDLVVLIKAEDNANFKNLVDILDEMHITNIRKYAIVDITEKELDLIKKI
ncbi:MAG: ExbD/TolR family protein [Cytophagaceae bacterium]